MKLRLSVAKQQVGPPAAPILILASGLRCGSTLLQRVLCTHPEIMIWGEQGGALWNLRACSEQLTEWERRFGEPARSELRRPDGAGFIAHLTPDAETQRAATIAFLDQLFGAPTRALGKQRWGFKELRYGRPFLEWFVELLPDTKAVHLTRDPVDVLRSLEHWEALYSWPAEEIESGLRHWRDVNESFADLAGLEGVVLPVRYEELVGHPTETLARVAAFFGILATELKHSELDRRIHGFGESGQRDRRMADRGDVLLRLRSRLPDEAFWQLAAHYGYDYLEPRQADADRQGRVGSRESPSAAS